MTDTSTLSFPDRLALLKRPLPSAWIRWSRGRSLAREDISPRVQAVPSISPAHLADWLDDVMGPERWCAEYRVGAAGVICRLGLQDDAGEWIFKECSGEPPQGVKRGAAGGEGASKPNLGESFLRAAMMWGIARYLWRFNAPWIVLVNGKVPRDTHVPLPSEMLPESERTPGAATTLVPYFVEEPQVIDATVPAPAPATQSVGTPAPPAPPPMAASPATVVPLPPPAAKRPEQPAQNADVWEGLELPGLDPRTLVLEPDVKSKVISIATSIKRRHVPPETSKAYINRPESAVIPREVREALLRLAEQQAQEQQAS